jgi:hypothetical protein
MLGLKIDLKTQYFWNYFSFFWAASPAIHFNPRFEAWDFSLLSGPQVLQL